MLNQNQNDMLMFLAGSSVINPLKLPERFPMATREVEAERTNYRDYLELFQAGYIRSERAGEWLTEKGQEALSEISAEV